MVYTGKTITMLQDALIKCLEGKTSFEEVYRTIEIENEDDDNYENEIATEIKETIPVEEEVQEDPDSLIEAPPTNSNTEEGTILLPPAFAAEVAGTEGTETPTLEDANNAVDISSLEAAAQVDNPVVTVPSASSTDSLDMPTITPMETVPTVPEMMAIPEMVSTSVELNGSADSNTSVVSPAVTDMTTAVQAPVVASPVTQVAEVAPVAGMDMTAAAPVQPVAVAQPYIDPNTGYAYTAPVADPNAAYAQPAVAPTEPVMAAPLTEPVMMAAPTEAVPIDYSVNPLTVYDVNGQPVTTPVADPNAYYVATPATTDIATPVATVTPVQ